MAQYGPCPWPGCNGSKPVTYAFCKECGNERREAMLFGTVNDMPMTAVHRYWLDLKARKKRQQSAKYQASERGREVRRRWKQGERTRPPVEGLARYKREVLEAQERARERQRKIRETARADVLVALIAEQQEDDRRTRIGSRWVMHLDGPIFPDGSGSAYDFVGSGSRHQVEWNDPTAAAALARVRMKEHLLALVEQHARSDVPDEWEAHLRVSPAA